MRRLGAVITGVLTVVGLLIPLMGAASAAANPFPRTAVGVALTPGGQGWWVAGADGVAQRGRRVIVQDRTNSWVMSRACIGRTQIDKEEFVVFVQGVAADRHGNRLG